MFLVSFNHWLSRTHIGILMRDSTYAFPVVEIVHLLALAIFGGGILLVDLRFLNLGFRTQSASTVARELLPVTAGGVLAMSISGLLMYAGGPLRYCHNPAFQLKMTLFVVALIVHFGLQISVSRSVSDKEEPVKMQKVGAVVSLLLWLSIGFAGRAIGYV
ncbi:DUF6644 family protein [Granulicella sp. WH15]|uniref:DUF6644 family protein n=1 Tax=Granulicella sp. WH15 TaxID=2602070 RepID=UPI0013A57CB3|nr:DUF6644 family protein [Granulicella sp. WH15]